MIGHSNVEWLSFSHVKIFNKECLVTPTLTRPFKAENTLNRL